MTAVGTWVEHSCRTVHSMSEDPVVHLVLPPRRPVTTPFSDLRDAGYEVVAVAPFPEEIPECPVAEGYPGCKQVLLRRSEAVRNRERRTTTIYL